MSDELEQPAGDPPVEAPAEERPAEGPETHEPTQEAEAGASTGAIAYYERVLAVGTTRSGKSELLNHLFSEMRCQRLLLDTKNEFTVEGVEPVSDVGAIDWAAPVIHYVDATGRKAEFSALFDACYHRRHLVVACHELGDLCEFNPGSTPPAVIRYINKGAAHGLGLLGASQRPVSIPVHSRTEAAHVLMVVPRLHPQDHETMAKTLGLPHDELAAAIDSHHQTHGDHAFLWWNRGTREISYWPPLPAELRKSGLITMRHAVSGSG